MAKQFGINLLKINRKNMFYQVMEAKLFDNNFVRMSFYEKIDELLTQIHNLSIETNKDNYK